MTYRHLSAIFLATTMMAAPSMASAQSRTAAGDAAATIATLQAQITAMQEQLQTVQAQVAAQAAAAKTQGEAIAAVEAKAKDPIKVSWKGAPEISGEDGWKFKVRGRLMYDVATVSSPGGMVDPGLGFSNELRRGRLGVQGSIPGNIGYKAEIDFAGGSAEFTDALIEFGAGDFDITVGQHNNFQSLEELSSSLHTSFIERAAFTDAFGFERRVGASIEYGKGDVLVQAGVFTDNISDLDDENNSYSVDGRVVFMPKVGNTQVHVGGSAHYRDLGDNPSARYRQRPAVHSTDTRFIATPNLPVSSETNFGLEAAAIHGPFHIAAEGSWLKADLMTPGAASPTFFGGYVEAGYFLTGESRGYKGGKFDRVKVKNSFSKGGFGAVSLNARFDYLDLNDAGIVGGQQNAYQASLNWKPTDYVLFGLNYAHIEYDDAAIATPSGSRNYSVDMIGLRSQIDF